MKENGVIGIASTLVNVDAKYRDLAGYLLGRTLVVITLIRNSHCKENISRQSVL